MSQHREQPGELPSPVIVGDGELAALIGNPATRTVPEATVVRLALYLRVLGVLADGAVATVSSEELASAAGVGSAKLRKDLSFLGSNGTRGVGYDVPRLVARLEATLGLDRKHQVALVGAGNLGHALAGYEGFSRRGFTVTALFDNDVTRVGERVGGTEIRHLDELHQVCAELGITIAVVATPADAAQHVCDLLVAAGVHCILNFAPVELVVPDRVDVRKVDLAVEMQVLSFHLTRRAAEVPAGSADVLEAGTAHDADRGERTRSGVGW